jgi:hypothetical protein
MKREGWREPTLSTKTPRRTKARRERTRLGSNFVACPRPKEARRTRLDADDIANRQTTSRQTQTSTQCDNQANVEERNKYKATSLYSQKDLDCKVQMTQFELLCRRAATNERTIEPFRLLNPPAHSCCTMPRFIGAPPGHRLPPGHANGMGPKPGRHACERARTNPERQARSSRKRLTTTRQDQTTRTRFRGH